MRSLFLNRTLVSITFNLPVLIKLILLFPLTLQNMCNIFHFTTQNNTALGHIIHSTHVFILPILDIAFTVSIAGVLLHTIQQSTLSTA